MEVYWQFFDAHAKSQSGATAAILTDEIHRNKTFIGRHHILGTAVLKARPLAMFSDAKYVEASFLHAKFMGPLAFEKLKNNDFEDVAYYEPSYVKDFFFGPKK
jgi:tRNA threonylcarbamoyladenosine biosynthesis protein TsaB